MRIRLLAALAKLITARPHLILVIALVLFVAGLAALPGLRITGGHTALAGAENVHEKRLGDFLEQFGIED